MMRTAMKSKNNNNKVIKKDLNIKMPKRQYDIVKSFLDPQYKYVTVVCARQVGKSFAARICALYAAIYPPFKETKAKVAYCMPTAEGAKLHYSETVKLLESFDKSNFKTNDTYKTILCPNGSKIEFLSCDIKSLSGLRGKTYDYMIVDEACFITDEAWNTIKPFLTVADNDGRGKVLLCTTAKNKNFFYTYYTSEDEDIKKIRFTAYQVPNANKKEIERQRLLMTDEAFAEEYLALFVDGMNSAFKTNLMKMKTRDEIKDKKAIVAAVDWAHSKDYTVLTLMNKNREVIDYFRWKDVNLNEMVAEIVNKCEQYGRPTIYSETNGVGGHPTDSLKIAYKGIVEGFVTHSTSKTNIITKMRDDIVKETDYITFIKDDVLRKEFENFGMEYAKNGGVKYGNMSSETNDDIVMSLCICNYHLEKHRGSTAPLIMSTNLKNKNYNANYRNRF